MRANLGNRRPGRPLELLTRPRDSLEPGIQFEHHADSAGSTRLRRTIKVASAVHNGCVRGISSVQRTLSLK